MGSKMLIDASQAEEIRVVVARGNKLEEFDFESASRAPLKGNIYLAKVTRVEPSLQAAFVEYGGNRHGFLAFTEIHPDYYQIPIADRLALLAEQEAEEAEQAARDQEDDAEDDVAEVETAPVVEAQTEVPEVYGPSLPLHMSSPEPVLASEPVAEDEAPDASLAGDVVEIGRDGENQKVETMGEEDALEEMPARRERNNRSRRKQYKIQEVIKRRQILLVQVVKEERGNKGAALTTYLSLAGRYCVLMPNTARGGGISRKITDAGDRRRLKEVTKDVEVPKGMGVIVRTAGAQRTRPEIKRDFDYLMRMWENVRDLTLKSSAPSLVYEEGNLIKRSIRDLYTKDVDEVLVAGEHAYREAKDFMRMLMPSHSKNVMLYKDPKPLFQRHGVEAALDSLYSPQVTLPSGGYLVINQTEALVSIDINSGRATREHNIEDTASQTNLEACDEIARQLRLRDLAGLVVIDFIDMEENRNNRKVEQRMKEALKNDRARIQVGRISHFGLLEMSRQRLRPGLLEGAFKPCPHCEGRGIVRSVSSCGLGILRQIEEFLQKGKPENLTVKCAHDVAFYLLNEKRDSLLEIEQTHGISIFLSPGGDDVRGSQATIERAPDRAKIKRSVSLAPVQMQTTAIDDLEEDEPEIEEAEAEGDVDVSDDNVVDAPEPNGERTEQDRTDGGRKRRRRGRRNGRRDEPRNGQGENPNAEASAEDTVDAEETLPSPRGEAETDEAPVEGQGERQENPDQQKRDRGERGGRRRGKFGLRRDRPERTGEPRPERSGEPRPERSAEPRQERSGEPRPERNSEASPPREQRQPQADQAPEARPEPRIERESAPQPRPEPVKIHIPEVIAAPEVRKWQPPTPTVTEAAAAKPRGGWWKK